MGAVGVEAWYRNIKHVACDVWSLKYAVSFTIGWTQIQLKVKNLIPMINTNTNDMKQVIRITEFVSNKKLWEIETTRTYKGETLPSYRAPLTNI